MVLIIILGVKTATANPVSNGFLITNSVKLFSPPKGPPNPASTNPPNIKAEPNTGVKNCPTLVIPLAVLPILDGVIVTREGISGISGISKPVKNFEVVTSLGFPNISNVGPEISSAILVVLNRISVVGCKISLGKLKSITFSSPNCLVKEVTSLPTFSGIAVTKKPVRDSSFGFPNILSIASFVGCAISEIIVLEVPGIPFNATAPGSSDFKKVEGRLRTSLNN